jgi:hypothetical protein
MPDGVSEPPPTPDATCPAGPAAGGGAATPLCAAVYSCELFSELASCAAVMSWFAQY